MTTRRRPRCEPVTDTAGQVIGMARTAGPLTEADLTAIREFDRYLRGRYAADHPDNPPDNPPDQQ